MSGLAPGCEGKKPGEGKKTIRSWFPEDPTPNPYRARNLLDLLDMKKIEAILAREDITDEEKDKLFKEEVNACAPPIPEFYKFESGNEMDMDEDLTEDEDEGSDEIEEDGEMGKAHLDTKKIQAILARKDLTDEEINRLLDEELDARYKLKCRKEEDMDKDDVEAEGEMGKTLQLGDHEKPDVLKRPHLSLVQSLLECKKPRVAEGLGFQGGETTVAAEM